MHGQSMLSVYRELDMSVLPDEYLPDDYTGPSAGTLQNITGIGCFLAIKTDIFLISNKASNTDISIKGT